MENGDADSDAGEEDAPRVSDNRSPHLSRRQFLKLLGIGTVGAAAGMTGAHQFFSNSGQWNRIRPTGHAPAAEAVDISFDETLTNSDIGVSPGSDRDIASAVNNHLSSGTRIELEAGEYRCESTIKLSNRSGIVGDPEDPSNVVLRGPKDQDTLWVATSGSSDVLVNGLTADQRDDFSTSMQAQFNSSGGLNVMNIHFKGNHPPGTSSNDTGVLVGTNITSKDGVGLFHNIQMDGRGPGYGYPKTRTMFWMGPGHKGVMRYNKMFFDIGSNHTIYGSRVRGAVQVTNSLFRNADNTNLRVSGTENGVAETFVKDSAIVIDSSQDPRDGITNYRGLQLECDTSASSLPPLSPNERPVIENCDFYCADAGSVGLSGLVRFRFNSHPGAIFRNCRFRDESGGDIFVFDNGDQQGGGVPDYVDFLDCHVSGNTNIKGAGNRKITVDGGCWSIDRPGSITFNDVASSGCDEPKDAENPVDWGSKVEPAGVGDTNGSSNGSSVDC